MRDTLLRRFESKINRVDNGCWLWTGSVHRTGYGQIIIEKGRPNYTHRVAWELYRGHIPKGMYVCHRCDVHACVNPEHLFLGTQADNMADCVAKDRQARGERAANAKFTTSDVLAFRASTETDAAIAKKYGVSRETIRDIRSGKNWSHIPLDNEEKT